MKVSKKKITAASAAAKKRSAAGPTSKERIFESAKNLFAGKRFRDVSVREIASDAGVNSALIGYHYGGKQQLFEEVYRSYAEPLAMERMRRLADLTQSGRKPSLEDILRAWLLPWLEGRGNSRKRILQVQFTANISAQKWKQNKKVENFTQQTHLAFIEALHHCLPNLSRETLTWRLHFIVGAVSFGLQDPNSLQAFSDGRCNPDDLENTFSQILAFAINGLGGPEPARR